MARQHLALAVVATLSACSDGGTGATAATAASATGASTGSTTAGTTDGTSDGTTGVTTGTAPTTGIAPTTDATTGPGPTTGISGTTDATTTSTTQPACDCEPGAPLGCASVYEQLVCAADCGEPDLDTCPQGQACIDTGCTDVACIPGAVACADENSVHTCAADGSGYDDPVPCAPTETCEAGACVSLCALAEASPRSIGCSFFAHTMDNYHPVVADSVVVGNVDPERTATVQLYTRMNGVEVPVGDPIELPPGQVAEFKLESPEIEGASELRPDGAYRVASDIPIVAYQHAPIGAQQTNDASMLLPEHALGKSYVIASAREGNTYPNQLSYFVVIATEDDTTVTWTPPVATLGGVGVPVVLANTTGEVNLDRMETLQVAAASKVDLSGTIVEADKPIWVVGASACVSIPINLNTCDHIEEQMLPIETWGKTYVGANAPKRGSEKFHWRVFGGKDGVTVTTTPDVSGGPFTLAKGEYKAFTAPQSFILTGDGPFLPVQYLESQNGGAGIGDPSTVQMVPVEQFLTAYAFATGTGYSKNYVQVIRTAGGPDVLVDGQVVSGYVTVGQYEIADWQIPEGNHFATSAMPFGIINIGYTNVTSYAYPGGMKLAVINPQ
ncbi:MAG TPA: IgGFc-binding protein [Nannocystis sp.]